MVKVIKHFLIMLIVFLGLFFHADVLFASFPDIHGFAEVSTGIKMSDDNTKRDNFNLLEQRVQLKSTYYFQGENYLSYKAASIYFKGDFILDEYYGAKTEADLREFNISLTPYDIVDVKFGRQVLTWGTGDYLFVNDLFPKDYISFFVGRDDEYLKKPSDALKMSLYPSWGNIDFIVSAFEANTQAKGDRLSFFDLFQGDIAGRNSERQILEPPIQLSNNEYYLRYYKNIGSNEVALYYFQGFDKNATSIKNEMTRQLFYRKLDVYGWSLRGPTAGGIGNLEFGYYNSREDSDGRYRLIENSMIKMLGGYEKDLGNDLKIGFQYLYEQKLDYDLYRSNLLPADLMFDERRHVLTQRIVKQYKHQTVTVILFNFYSPSDKDGYLRPSISYDFSDQWKFTMGANVPWGEDNMTEFGQMKKNKNIYVRARYSF